MAWVELLLVENFTNKSLNKDNVAWLARAPLGFKMSSVSNI